MKIRYVHCSEPSKQKIMDSEVLRSRDADFARSVFREDDRTSQKDYDAKLLADLTQKKETGIILSCEVVSE